MKLQAVLLLLILCITGIAGELKVVGETKIKEHRVGKIEIQGIADAAQVRWSVPTSLDVIKQGRTLIFAGPPGTYKVNALVIDFDAKTFEETDITLTIEGKATPPPPTKSDPKAALCRLRVGRSGCTATIIGPRRPDGRWDVLTASHCLDAATTGTITLGDGRTLRVSKTAQDYKADLCWLVTEDAGLELPHAFLAETHPPTGTAIWHQGFGVDRPGNREEGVVLDAPRTDNKFRMRLSVSSGDSGGGIFHAKTGEWVSCVCCTISPSPPGGNTYGGSVNRARALRPTTTKSAGAGGCWHPILDLDDEALDHPILLYPAD